MPRVLRLRVVMKRMGRNVDWDSQDGHHRVRLYGKWIPVPDEPVITEPTPFAPAVVWPYLDSTETTRIRCFFPGQELLSCGQYPLLSRTRSTNWRTRLCGEYLRARGVQRVVRSNSSTSPKLFWGDRFLRPPRPAGPKS